MNKRMDKLFEIFKMEHFKIVTQVGVNPCPFVETSQTEYCKTVHTKKKYVKIIMTLYAEKKIKICFSHIYNRMSNEF